MEEGASSLESPNEAPWLVFPYGEGKKNHVLYNIWEPHNTTSRKSIPELSGKTFWQKPSHQGWLIVLCDVKDDNSMPNCKYGDCFLWNPLTLETIQLPSLLKWITFEPDDEYIIDCVLSSPPRTTATSANVNVDVDCNDNDPLVLVLYQSMSDFSAYTFLFCHPGEKQRRTQLFSEEIDGEKCEVSDLRCLRNKLYAIGVNGDCLEIEKQHQGPTDDNVSLSIKSFHVDNNTSFQLSGASGTFRGWTYFAEGRDDIFMIYIGFNDRGSERVIISVCITRLDFMLKEWKLVYSLGDDVLFVGRKNSVCCSAAKLGLAKGCLYYTHPSRKLEQFCLPMGSRISPADLGLGLYKFEVECAGDYDISPCLRLPEPVFAPDWIMIPDGQIRKGGKLNINDEDQYYISKAGEDRISISSYNDSENESTKQFVRFNTPDLEEERPWGVLNQDMVVLIASYLHPLDYVHFRSVCKANRQTMPVVGSTFTSNQVLETTYLSPWLLFCADNSSTVYNFVNPMHNDEEYLVNFSELLLGATIRFQKEGWLLLSREDELFFYNPFTKEIIVLPDYPGCYDTSDISFSSIPTSSCCIIFAIEESGSYEENDSKISIHCIRRGEQAWDSFELNEELYSPFRNTPTSFGGDFYSVGYNGALGNFNLENGNLNYEVLEKPYQQFEDSYPSFLVECGGDLLLVKLGCLEMPVRIFRMDFAEMEWVKVKSLGKHMLFISGITCFSAISPKSGMENKVFFPRLCLNGEGVLFYSLESGNYHSFRTQQLAKNFCGTKGWLGNCTWIEPNWSKSTPQELVWFKPSPVT